MNYFALLAYPKTIIIVIFRKSFLILLGLTTLYNHLFAQDVPIIRSVNPFIGTSNTRTPSLWGSEGGTYPGAVVPFGFVQLSPETRKGDSNGYNYLDSTICYFSCINHPSGYPDGSSGMIHIMPLQSGIDFRNWKYIRPFNHHDELAEPGFYSVLFRDDGTLTEISAAEHSGMFRFRFPPHAKPKIFISDLGKIEIVSKKILHGETCHAILSFSADILSTEEIYGGSVLTFAPVEHGKNTLLLKIGVSPVDFESARNNLRSEAANLNFDQFKALNQRKWEKALSVITVEDSSIINRTIFYTALYHSLLMPWIISDVSGNYKGADGKIHKTKGKNEYGGFSAWDTFRSLHPLLSLITPEKQQDMVVSMLDEFEQSGTLPIGPMTGNHVIDIIVDSYLKGICHFDKVLAYKAMKACLDSASGSKDFSAYLNLGYVPASCSESVTKTVEFAYDDWALSQFAGKVMGDQDEYNKLVKRSFNYRKLFNSDAMAMLPRQGNKFNLNPGNSGFKEGDQWSYSMFVPQNPIDLVNLFGGDTEFAEHLDSALRKQFILFDNEPVLHGPYLFNYANRADLAQKWVRNLLKTHYSSLPWGLPGNDDHGAMSSWYVFGAMGFYPVCPGRPVYDIGSPIFKKVTIHLQNGKKWVIRTKNNGTDQLFIKSILLNGQPFNNSWITHSMIARGGELTFQMDKSPQQIGQTVSETGAPSETKKTTDFQFAGFSLSKKQVRPDQPFTVNFTLKNDGSKGTKVVRLFVDGKEYTKKNILMDENSVMRDSILCRLYPLGTRLVRLDQLKEQSIEVVPQSNSLSSTFQVLDLRNNAVVKIHNPLIYTFITQNKGGLNETKTIPVLVDDTIRNEMLISLAPGEIKKIEGRLVFKSEGIHRLQIGSKLNYIKIYNRNTDSGVLDLDVNAMVIGNKINDQSGLRNDGLICGKASNDYPYLQAVKADSIGYAVIPNANSLDNLDERITIMAWVKPIGNNMGLADIITKGDFMALQSSGNKSLSWFAGGWGRGSCSAEVPGNWMNNWHHIAGVADGKSLKIYIDGVESGSVTLTPPVNLSSRARWMLGRNEEFPDQRFFNGFINHFKIFVEPLSGTEILSEMQIGRPIKEN